MNPTERPQRGTTALSRAAVPSPVGLLNLHVSLDEDGALVRVGGDAPDPTTDAERWRAGLGALLAIAVFLAARYLRGE